jgi:uncharacterized membrane protein
MNSKGVAGLYFILGYVGCFIACIESELIYVRVLAGAYATLLTFQLLQSNENNNDDFINGDTI